jgi:hypothetical protein
VFNKVVTDSVNCLCATGSIVSIFDMQIAANRGINFAALSLDPRGPKRSVNDAVTQVSAPNALSVPHILTGVLAYNLQAV